MTEENLIPKSFAFIVDGDVFFIMTLDPSLHEKIPMIIAGLSSDPKIILLPENSPVREGWFWDGQQFNQNI